MPEHITYPGVYIEELPGPPMINPVATSIAAFIGNANTGPVNEPVLIKSFPDFERTFGGLSRSSPMSYAVQQFYANGGIEALIVRVDKPEDVMTDADVLGTRASRTGIYALEKADLFNLLCIPPLDFATDPTPTLTLLPALEFCKERRAMLIVDPPGSWVTKDDATNSIGAFMPRDANAAVYFPRLLIPDPLQKDRLVACVPCGAVCGVIARTDAERGVWNSPSGLNATIVGVSELTCELTDADLADLDQAGLNCLRTLPVGGKVIWGARTLDGAEGVASEWKYVPVRRLALFVEESIGRGLQWVAFEPNDESLWAKIRRMIDAFMMMLFRQGAFQGSTTSEAYTVKCDAETTTQADINSGVVNVLVGFAPSRPAEFLVLKIKQRCG